MLVIGIRGFEAVKKRILLVEDDPDTTEMLLLELETLGYEIIVARDGVEAVQMASSELPNLIVMDILMPKMDGLQATSLIRKNPKTQDTPILAATAMTLAGAREKCLASGCDDYIAKPFTHLELGRTIEKLLRKKPA